MIYHFDLRTVGIFAGAILLILGLIGVAWTGGFQNWAKHLPRSRVAGIVLLTMALIWSVWLLTTMEMGEFATFRRPLLILLPVGYFLVLRFVEEFLAVRALGILCLLAAEPLLDAAFFRNEPARLVVTTFAYILVVIGIIWVTMPYLLRDKINWMSRSNMRWRAIFVLILAYGVAMTALAVTMY